MTIRTGLDPRLERIARTALNDEPDFPRAVATFRDRVERDPKLLVALIGRAELDRLEAAAVQKVDKGFAGRSLGQAVGRVPPAPAVASARERARIIREDASSILWSMSVGHKWLGACTRAEIAKEVAESGQKVAFLRDILAILPKDPRAVVRDHVTAGKADELWERVTGKTRKVA